MMSSRFIVIFYLVFQVTYVITEVTIPEKCEISDSTCLRKTAQLFLPYFAEGIKELKIKPLDVMRIEEIDFSLAGLLLALKKVKVSGMAKSQIEALNVNMVDKEIFLQYYNDAVTTGKYKAGGRLLILPISGEGDFLMELTRAQINLTMPFDLEQVNGKDTIKLTGYKYKYNVKDGAYFNLTNLFNGNARLGNGMLKFMNSNWRTLCEEFGGPLFDTPVKIVYNAIKSYLSSRPIEDFAVLNP